MIPYSTSSSSEEDLTCGKLKKMKKGKEQTKKGKDETTKEKEQTIIQGLVQGVILLDFTQET